MIHAILKRKTFIEVAFIIIIIIIIIFIIIIIIIIVIIIIITIIIVVIIIIIIIIVILLYQRNTMQRLRFKLFDKLIRLELAEASQTLSSSTNQSFKSEINVNLSTSESLEAMFNIVLKQIDKQINCKATSDMAIIHNLWVELCFFISDK